MAQSFPPPADADGQTQEDADYARAVNNIEELDLSKLRDEGLQQHADDAEDYFDLSDDDDDLPDEEPQAAAKDLNSSGSTKTFGADGSPSFTYENGTAGNEEIGNGTGDMNMDDVDALFNDDEDLFGGDDDLFNDNPPNAQQPVTGEPLQSIEDTIAVIEEPAPEPEVEEEEEEEEEDEQVLEQRRLFGMSRAGASFTQPTESYGTDLIQRWFPDFKQGQTLKFTELLPSGRARYVGKTPLKPPKPVLPTKISLDIAKDQEKDFKLLAGGHKRTWDETANPCIVTTTKEEVNASDAGDQTDEDSDYENETVGGFSWRDLQIVCDDWELPVDHDDNTSEPADDELIHMVMDEDNFAADWETGRLGSKRRKLEPSSQDILNSIPRYHFTSFHDPAKATARIASRVILDLNDPYLLVNEIHADENTDAHKNVSAQDHGDKKTQRLAARYNISNDQEYDQLTAQHQSKSRSTLGSLAVSHSMPALRLQWPYYKTKLEKQECRSFHRPHSLFPKMENIYFKTPHNVKKKHIRGKETTEIFNNTVDLSLGDNSHVLLLEYSEQHPVMMSNFGMNSRLINYYRRKDLEDMTRPKREIGELSVLQPQDTSPLTQFGNIDPGEVTPAIYNGMFKAPVFEQAPKSTDFVLVRNATGVEGSTWFLRNIEYMRTVGQQFPSTEVPGPNARKVTTAAKNRLKMVSYRLLKKSKTHTIVVSKVTPHVLDPSGGPSNDMQNRQKLKEFLTFNKEHKEWELKAGETLPTSEKIRDLVKPEDVCLLEAMQVGSQQLEDAGFGANADTLLEDGQSDDEVNEEDQNLEQSLVPWQTTKNFITAANNKAMLQVHGEGDPSKRGEAFSMLKISMKGGFRAEGESITDKLDAAKVKELGGHSYNVAKQAESYNRSVRNVWEKQKESLSSNIEPELDPDEDEEDQEENPVLSSMMDGPDVQTTVQPTHAAPRQGRDDQSVSQFSHISRGSQQRDGHLLKITRLVKNRMGEDEEQTEVVRDPRVIRQYLKLRKLKDSEKLDLNDISALDATNPEVQKRIAAELARLERNKDRRLGREKQKGGGSADFAGSPGTPGADDQPKTKGKGSTGGTGRKCANCGQIGHIKTNKKLCPMLNGQMKQDDNFGEQNFTLSTAQL